MSRSKGYKKFTVLLLIVCLPLCAALAAGAQNEPDALGGSTFTKSDRKFTGSYLVSVTPDGPQPPFRSLVSVHDGGTIQLTETTDFGVGNLPANGFNSPAHGAWEKTGPRELTARLLFFHYDAAGTLLTIVRVTNVWGFDHRADSFNGVFEAQVFAASQDPLDPSSVPIVTFTGTNSGRRIEVD